MKSKNVKKLKEKIDVEAKEDFDFEQHLFKKYPLLFPTSEDGQLLPQMQRCWNDCPKGWEPIVDNLFGCIDDYVKNTTRTKLNPDKKTKIWVYEKMWKPVRAKIDNLFNPYHASKMILKFNSPSKEQKEKIDASFSMKVRRLTSRITAWFLSEMYVSYKPPQVKIAQYKEKFGTLRVYADGVNDDVCGMIRFAEYLSSKTCQYTGEAGSLRNIGQWYITLSEEQYSKVNPKP